MTIEPQPGSQRTSIIVTIVVAVIGMVGAVIVGVVNVDVLERARDNEATSTANVALIASAQNEIQATETKIAETLYVLTTVSPTTFISDQARTIRCGDTITQEFRFPREAHKFSVNFLSHPDVKIFIDTPGDLETRIRFYSPGEFKLRDSYDGSSMSRLLPETILDIGYIASTDTYSFIVENFNSDGTYGDETGGIGQYNIHVQCN